VPTVDEVASFDGSFDGSFDASFDGSFDAEEDEDQIGEQIAFLFDRIAAAGTTWHAERERVRALVLGN
jgi:hypothetical protein